MFKKIRIASLIATASLTILGSPDTNNRPLNENNLPKYAEEYSKALFGTHRDDQRETREYIKQVKTKAVNCAESNCEQYELIMGFIPIFTGTFKRECVEQAVRTAALEQIVENAHSFGYGYTHDTPTLNFIKERLRDDILQLYQRTESQGGRLNGALKYYRGDALKDYVWDLKKQYDARVKTMNQILDETYAFGCEYAQDEATRTFITKTIREELAQLIQKSNMPNGALNNYRGENLKQRVRNLKKEYDAQHKTQQTKTYASDTCCVCYESFDDVEPVFLPCGHDMCGECANAWLAKNNTCPQCRAEVIRRA